MKKDPVDFRQLENYANFMRQVGWKVVSISNLFPEPVKQFGYIYETSDYNLKLLQLHRIEPNINLSKLENFTKQNNIYSLRVGFNITSQDSRCKDLAQTLIKLKFKRIPWCNAPTKTQIISIHGRTMSQLSRSLKPKTRYNINLAKKKNTIVRKFDMAINPPSDKNKKQFWHLVKNSLKNNNILSLSYRQFNQLLSSLKSSAQLFLTLNKNQVTAGVLFIKTRDTLYYTLNGSSDIGKSQFAPTLLVWEGINYASKQSMQYFDFEGIVDERNLELTSTWKGFSNFKQSFLGGPVKYMMPYEKVYSPTMKHKISELAKTITGRRTSLILPSIYPTRVNLF